MPSCVRYIFMRKSDLQVCPTLLLRSKHQSVSVQTLTRYVFLSKWSVFNVTYCLQFSTLVRKEFIDLASWRWTVVSVDATTWSGPCEGHSLGIHSFFVARGNGQIRFCYPSERLQHMWWGKHCRSCMVAHSYDKRMTLRRKIWRN